MIDEDALLASFVEESQQHLQTIEPDLLDLEKGSETVDSEMLNRIFRSIHSIKGASGFFGLKKIGELSHVMESLLSLLRDRKISVTQELTDALLAGVDMLRSMVDDVVGSENFDIHAEVNALRNILENKNTSVSGEDISKKVTVSEQIQDTGDVRKPKTLEITEEEYKRLVSRGKYLYSAKLLLNKDLREKGKTPFSYINEMELMGTFIDSYLDVDGVTSLDDCLENELAFNFLFATVLDPDLIPGALEIPDDRVTVFDLNSAIKMGEETANTDTISETSPEIPLKTEKDIAQPPREEFQRKSSDDELTEKAKSSRVVQTEDKLRVGVNLLNELVNMAGELVLGRNQLLEISAPLAKQTPGLNTVLQHVSRVTTEMQEKIMQLRMQPVSVIFGKFHRVVRDISRSLNKEIVLETFGEDVELDKSIIESLSDPLTHLIRNSADHGIESPDVRENSGKPRQGKIILKAYHEGGQVHLAISDDGKGIDTKIISEKALEKGVITRQQLIAMSEKDILKLIFSPGFSTAQTVSSVSGRGVGMDVVRTNIEHLGGTVEIETEVNKGTTIKLVLPLTLAIVSGLVVKVWDQPFILPEANIDEMVRIKPEEIMARINKVIMPRYCGFGK